MLEKLYTRKVVVALMALILAANGLLLYEFQIKPPTQTANTPSSEGSPRIADAPRQEEAEGKPEGKSEGKSEEEAEEPANEEEDGSGEDESESPGAGEPRQGSGGEEEPPGGESPPQGAASPETPFESQYDPPPTMPGSGGSGSGDPSRIRVALASFYDSGPGEASVLPATSGVVFLPAAMFVGAIVVGAVVVGAIRRR